MMSVMSSLLSHVTILVTRHAATALSGDECPLWATWPPPATWPACSEWVYLVRGTCNFYIKYILYVDTVGHINRNYHTDSEQFEVLVTVEDMDIMMRVHSAGASAGVAACSAPSASAAGGVSSGGASRWTILPPGPYTWGGINQSEDSIGSIDQS